ncbi:MAG: type II toxin-antitoxin system HicB family antitoxin [Devosia sp.]
MDYRAKFERDGKGYIVTFPTVPEAITGGADLDEAKANAVDALEVALLTYVVDGRPLPVEPKSRGAGGSYRMVGVSAATAAKLAFIEAFKASGLTRVALAERLGKAETEVRRMLDPYHATKLPSIEAGLRALGKRLVVRIEEAA